MSKATTTAVVGVAAIAAVAGLIMTGHRDAADIGVVGTLMAQILNLIWSAHIEVKVNGNLSKLISAKTIPDLARVVEGVVKHDITVTATPDAPPEPKSVTPPEPAP